MGDSSQRTLSGCNMVKFILYACLVVIALGRSASSSRLPYLSGIYEPSAVHLSSGARHIEKREAVRNDDQGPRPYQRRPVSSNPTVYYGKDGSQATNLAFRPNVHGSNPHRPYPKPNIFLLHGSREFTWN